MSRWSRTPTPRPSSGSCRCTASRSSRIEPGYTGRRPVAGSSNGRTPDSGSGSWGSNPCPAASGHAWHVDAELSAPILPLDEAPLFARLLDHDEALLLVDDAVRRRIVAGQDDEPRRIAPHGL